MADKTAIEWTDATWNPIGGCSIKSPGCINCYAQLLCGTRLAQHPLYAGTTTMMKGKPVFNGKLTAAPDDHAVWTWPLKWRGAKQPKLGPGQPSLIFVGDMSDLFHEDRDPKVIAKVVATAALTRRKICQLLTKRSDRMVALLTSDDFYDEIERQMNEIAPAHWHDRELVDAGGWPLPNLWLGFSAERQQEFDERWPAMRELAARGWTIFVSVEPMLGPVVLPPDFLALGRRAQVIAGGESGPDARDCDVANIRSLLVQCRAAGNAILIKQLGRCPRDSGLVAEGSAPLRLRDKKGGDMAEWPGDLRVREFPR